MKTEGGGGGWEWKSLEAEEYRLLKNFITAINEEQPAGIPHNFKKNFLAQIFLTPNCIPL
jgi:hypothetical protein